MPPNDPRLPDEAITGNAALGRIERGRPVFPPGAVYGRVFPHALPVAGSPARFGVTGRTSCF